MANPDSKPRTMRERFSAAAFLCRWLLAVFFLYMGFTSLREPDGKTKDVLIGILCGAALAGSEVWLRLSRATLAAYPDGRVELFQRSTLAGSFHAGQLRYYAWTMKLKPLLIGGGFCVLAIVLGLYSASLLGASLAALGFVFLAALIYDYRTYWQLEAPKENGGTWNLTLGKADTIALLGFWPADKRPQQAPAPAVETIAKAAAVPVAAPAIPEGVVVRAEEHPAPDPDPLPVEPYTTTIRLPVVRQEKGLAVYEPFGDGRRIEAYPLGFTMHGGFGVEQSRQILEANGWRFRLVFYLDREMIYRENVGAENSPHFEMGGIYFRSGAPVYRAVVEMPGVRLSIRRGPGEFTDDDIQKILEAIEIRKLPPDTA